MHMDARTSQRAPITLLQVNYYWYSGRRVCFVTERREWLILFLENISDLLFPIWIIYGIVLYLLFCVHGLHMQKKVSFLVYFRKVLWKFGAKSASPNYLDQPKLSKFLTLSTHFNLFRLFPFLSRSSKSGQMLSRLDVLDNWFIMVNLAKKTFMIRNTLWDSSTFQTPFIDFFFHKASSSPMHRHRLALRQTSKTSTLIINWGLLNARHYHYQTF